MMYGYEKSDPFIVAVKPVNDGGQPSVELVEPRKGAKGNTHQSPTHRTQGRRSVPHGLDRVRQAAKDKKGEPFTALLHHIDVELLRSAYGWLRKAASAGVDGVTWDAYGEGLELRLVDLRERIHRGAYRAQPSRRVFIPKPDGRERPLGIAALEDKIVQRALVEVLSAVWEEEFVGFSHGFRPGRGQHGALDALAVGINRYKVNWILDSDIAGFFDTVDHEHLMRFVEHRIADPRVLTLIRKWLKAGVMEDDVVTPGTVGTPQGAVISPLLANIYLHFVFDLWANQWRKRHARGDVIIVRYADDIVVGFEHEADARRFLDEMRERLAAFALTLHGEKTRLIRFGRFAVLNRNERGEGKPETFNFLGFTHICGHSRAGRFQLKRKSRRDRVRTRLEAIEEGLRRRLHLTIDEQGNWLRQVVGGWLAYHAVPTNFETLSAFRRHVSRLWLRTLRRRGQKDRTSWDRMEALVERWLPKPRITHPWPHERFAVKYPRWEPYAGIPHVRFCAGGAR